MIKANKNTLIITSIVTVLPILAGILLWNRLPDMMATNFGINNQANGYSSKTFAVFGIPLVCLALLWFAAFITAHDPKKQNISPKMFTLALWIIPLVSLAVAAIIYPYNLGCPVDISFVMGLLLGLLFAVLGSYLPKIRQNYTIGIRIPWTLANEENWDRTHRVGGYLWVIGGISIIILTLTGVPWGGLHYGILAVMVLIPFGYSFWLHAAGNL